MIIFKKEVNHNGVIFPPNTPVDESEFTEQELENFRDWTEDVVKLDDDGKPKLGVIPGQLVYEKINLAEFKPGKAEKLFRCHNCNQILSKENINEIRSNR